jgi:hypothetical protein
VVAQVVLGLVHDVHVEVLVDQVRNLALRGGERLREVIDVLRRERHAEDDLHAGDLAQAAERLDLAAPAALDAADLVVHGLVAVGADRDDDLLRRHLPYLTRALDDLVREVAVGREVQEEEILAAGGERLADVDEVLAEPDLAPGEIDPQEARRAREELPDLLEP